MWPRWSSFLLSLLLCLYLAHGNFTPNPTLRLIVKFDESVNVLANLAPTKQLAAQLRDGALSNTVRTAFAAQHRQQQGVAGDKPSSNWLSTKSRALLPTDPDRPELQEALAQQVEAFYYSTSSKAYILQAVSQDAKDSLLATLKNSAVVRSVKVDQKMTAYSPPNDQDSPDLMPHTVVNEVNDVLAKWQWNLDMVGAPQAWQVTRGSRKVVVGVLDTGVDVNHQDLKNAMWINPGEVPDDGIDNDGNGYIDDIHGWDFTNIRPAIYDTDEHGTHCAGIVGAVANNSFGVSGIAPNISIMALTTSLYNSEIVEALEYALTNGAHMTTNSWGSYSQSEEISAAIQAAEQAGQLFVVAAGNLLVNSTAYEWPGDDESERCNNDVTPQYPTNEEYENVLSVASSNHLDIPSSFTCYGATTVDMFAPGGDRREFFGWKHGVGILSTIPDGFKWMRGTSMATPLVAGAAALVMSRLVELDYPIKGQARTVKRILMASVDQLPQYSGYVVTGGRLNITRALQMTEMLARAPRPPSPPPPRPPPPPFTVAGCPLGQPTGLSLMGRRNLTNDPLAVGDDVAWQVLPTSARQPNFTVWYLGREYSFSQIYMSSNSYLTFGDSSTVYSGLGVRSPSIPAWLLGANDTSSLSFHAGTEEVSGQVVVRLRWAGHQSSSGGVASAPTILYEIVFWPGQRVTITIGQHGRLDNGFWGMSDGAGRLGRLVAAIPACRRCSLTLCSDPQGYSWAISSVNPPPAPPSPPPAPPSPPSPPLYGDAPSPPPYYGSQPPVYGFDAPPPPPFTAGGCPLGQPAGLKLMGQNNLTNYTDDAAGDDWNWQVLPEDALQPNFTMWYLGSEYNFSGIYMSSNSYLTFGYGSSVYTDLGTYNPGFPAWLLGAGDTSSLTFYAGIENIYGEAVVRFQWAGHQSSSGGVATAPTILYEIVFWPGQRVTITIGQHGRRSDGFWGMSDGQGRLVAEIPACEQCTITLCSDSEGYSWAISSVTLLPAPLQPPSAPSAR